MRVYDLDEGSTIPQTVSYGQAPIQPEAELESILHVTPSVLLDETLLIIGRQVRLETGVADLVACDQFGNVVVVEVKIGRSGSGSASEETILSQPQAYASSLSTYDYDALNDVYIEYLTRLDDGEWDIGPDIACGGTLRSAAEARFGTDFDEDEFNTEQRLVVVAEEITERTAANVRFLLEKGLHFQCSEVRKFTSPTEQEDGHAALVSSVIVDYDLGRVRPKSRPSPTYPELAGEILERAFPEFQDVVDGDSLSDVLPDGLDAREHRLISNNPVHPESMVYRLDVKPDDHTVLIGIDARGNDDEVIGRIQSNEDVFSAHGFEITGNKTYRVVVAEWDLEAPREVQEVTEEVADQYARLVQIGHDVLRDRGAS